MCVFFSPVGATSVLCPFSQRGDGGRPGGGHHAHLPAVCLLHHQGERSTERTTTAYTELKKTCRINASSWPSSTFVSKAIRNDFNILGNQLTSCPTRHDFLAKIEE